MAKQYLIIFLFIIPLYGVVTLNGTASPDSLAISSFEFTHTNGTILNLADYNDKPILLEWGASWCTSCHANIKTLNKIYPNYGDSINFLSLSYGGSGDTLDKIISTPGYKGSSPWDFGLDHTNAASTPEINARNAYIFILSENLIVLKKWEFTTIVTDKQINELTSNLDRSLGEEIENTNFGTSPNSENGGIEILVVFAIIGTVSIFSFAYVKRNQTNLVQIDLSIKKSNRKQQNHLKDLKNIVNEKIVTKDKLNSNNINSIGSLSPSRKNNISYKRKHRR